MSESDEGPQIARSPKEIDEKIGEFRSHGDYSHGPRGENLRYKHQGWINALLWVQGSDLGVEP